MYYCYVLFSFKDKKLYIGFSTDLKRRCIFLFPFFLLSVFIEKFKKKCYFHCYIMLLITYLGDQCNSERNIFQILPMNSRSGHRMPHR
ncbi:GIY-YIG nuclease family protein [bacterium]|nr:GIY-YIG nuclease family protein [bacterium]